jgi:hypothetical protein
MKIYVNERNEIHEVNTCSDPSLIELEVTDGTFDGWSEAKICCYKVSVLYGKVIMLTPYIDSRLIEHIDQLGRQTEAITPWTASKTAYIDDTEVMFTDVPQGSMSVYMDAPHTYVRDGSMVTVKFEPLEEVQTVTINII